MALPSFEKLAQLSDSEQSEAIGLLFEPCPTLVSLVRPLVCTTATWSAFIDAVQAKLHELDQADPRVTKIVAAHPRLGAAKVDSAQSAAEQASLGDSSPEMAEALQNSNMQYEQTFPGLRFVTFVNKRPRSVILAEIAARIRENNASLEIARAFDAMCDIARDRLTKLTGGET